MNPDTEPPRAVLRDGTLETGQDLLWRLHTMAQLLHRAARTVWVRADEEGPESPLHSLGLGIYLAHGHTQLLLPEYHGVGGELAANGGGSVAGAEAQMDGVVSVEVELDAVDERTAVQLLTEVEELSRPLPRADLGDVSQLVVALRELIREAEHRGC